jgi:DNA invertase Pin-like site-specific DNA recombinase
MRMRAALYARVSSEEQVEGYSIDAQRRAFESLVQAKEWTKCGEYVDEGKSARTDNIERRPAFKQMVDDALSAKFDVLVVHKLDRFSRNLRLTLDYFDRLDKAGVSFVSIGEQMDFTTASGKVHLALLGAFAQYYSDNLSQETKKGWAERKAQGLYCGALPFGATKGKDGIPCPDEQERHVSGNGGQKTAHNYEGLLMAFEQAAKGQSDKEIAIKLNSLGYTTTGTHGPRPFSKDTVKRMLKNRFYIGELPDGNGGWIQAKHGSLIDPELFAQVQELRHERRKNKGGSVRADASVFSLSGLLWCAVCGSKAGIHRNHSGKPRVYCRGRAEGTQCNCQATFLEVYEAQLEWYLETFVIPEDYREKILRMHRELLAAYDDPSNRRAALQDRLVRIKELYGWGHKSQAEYLADYEAIQRELSGLTPPEDNKKTLENLSAFLNNVRAAWKQADHAQRNKLANALFEQIWIEHTRIVGVKPREELRPLFRLSYDEHVRGTTSDSESPWGRQQYLQRNTRSSP